MSNDSYKSESICAISSPPGIGGVSLIRISGPDSFSIVGKIFSKSLKDISGYQVIYGKIIEKKQIIGSISFEIFEKMTDNEKQYYLKNIYFPIGSFRF
mgnify:CR=1 FL=1